MIHKEQQHAAGTTAQTTATRSRSPLPDNAGYASATRLATARDTVADETRATLEGADLTQVAKMIDVISQAQRVVVVGAGRSKLSAEGFAMRLTHMGVEAHVFSDVTSPAVTSGDVVVACSGSGGTPTVCELARTARESDAELVAVCANPDSELVRIATLAVLLQERGSDGRPNTSQQFVGTLFEQAALLLFDTVVLALQQSGVVDDRDMTERHTNME
ncbi:6-phospho-3-hexuloisomerase [Streptomyces sp. NPDC005012]|uniref:6-phospho-3-hexuloisomerase n=1 Tax=Streptomyces sp. NPDC005012 TaxID=3154558 RepID=UPI0033B9D108